VVVARLVGGDRPSFAPLVITLPRLGGSRVDLALGILLLVILGWGWAVRHFRRGRMPRWAAVGSWVVAAITAYASWQLLIRALSPLV
jgi:hypothetical protein